MKFFVQFCLTNNDLSKASKPGGSLVDILLDQGGVVTTHLDDMRQPFVTEAELLFGEIAQCFGEWKLRFGRAQIGSA